MGLMGQPETALVEKIKTAVKKRYPSAMIVKIHGGPYQAAGLPDLVVVIDGRIYGFEVTQQRLGESTEHAYGRAPSLQQTPPADLRRAAGRGAAGPRGDQLPG